MTQITQDFLKPYFKGEKKHIAYEKTCEIMDRLKSHANGEHPSYHKTTLKDGRRSKDMSDIITEKRPNEQENSKEYRNKIFVPITKSTVSKIFSSLLKIRKSRDWHIKWDEKKVSAKIKKGETLKEYCETNYPYFNSVTNWMFNVGLKHYGIDPNGVTAIIPLELKITDGTFYKPFAFSFDSDQVYDFVQDDYAILYSTDKSTYTDGNMTYDNGNVFYVIDTRSVQRWEQINLAGDMTLKQECVHGLNELPVFKNKGVFYKAMDKIFIWESRLDPIVPRLTEAAREYNDLQIEKVLHVHSETWEWASQDCTFCAGTGKVTQGKGSVVCTAPGCNSGKTIISPFGKIVVSAGMAGAPPAPIPPKGYIEKKSTEIVKIITEGVREHLYEALSAINMQFMGEVPLTQSGKAKEVDRDELNNFVSGIAEDIVWIMDRIYYFTNEYRNKVVVSNKEERMQQLPKVAVPDKFDMISIETSLDMIIKARSNNLSSELITALELEYAQSQFSADPEIKERLQLTFYLDPLPGLTQDVKDSMLLNKGITELDYCISCNLSQFINRAMYENPEDEGAKKIGFEDMTFDEMNTIIEGYAKEKLNEISAKEKVKQQIELTQMKAAASFSKVA